MVDEWKLFATVTEKLSSTRILLYGPPGTGKTSRAVKTADDKDSFYSITLNEESSVSELLGMWIPAENGFEWIHGVGIKAWREGKLLVINEIDKASGSVLTILHTLLDDRRVAKLTLPTGRTVRPKKAFRVIATMNGHVNDIPEALADRFGLKLNITKPHPDIVKTLPKDLQPLVESAYSSKNLAITFRDIVSFAELREVVGDDAYVVFGNMAKDVKTALALGLREPDVIEEPVVIDEIIDDVDASSDIGELEPDIKKYGSEKLKISKRELARYWDNISYDDLNKDVLSGYFSKVASATSNVLTRSLISEIDIAFAIQKSNPTIFKRKITNIYKRVQDL